MFLQSGSQATSFSIPNGIAIFWREPPNRGIECRWGRQKSQFWVYIWHAVNAAYGQVLSTRCHQTTVPQFVITLVISRGVCWWREMMTKCLWQEVSSTLNVTPKATEQHLLACSDKSVFCVTKIKDSARRFLLVCVSWTITGQPSSSAECSQYKPPFSFFRGHRLGLATMTDQCL